MIEAVKPLNLAEFDHVSSLQGDDMLFEKYELSDLQYAVCIFFYYIEFMENVRDIFKDCQQSRTLDLQKPCSVYMVFSQISTMLQ